MTNRNASNERFSVSLPPDLARAIRAEADQYYEGNLSAALAAAIGQWAADATTRAEGLRAMAEYAESEGHFTERELADARARVAVQMGWPSTDPRLTKDRHVA